MTIVERFIRYAEIDTQSDPKSGLTPSTEKQFQLAKLLVSELEELGIKDVRLTDKCSVYAHLESNLDREVPTVGFIAHMDTAPDYTAEHVHPRVIENYDGRDIELCPGVVTRVSDFPVLSSYKGESLIVTDGSTLLGGDDKAGVAAIMDAVSYLVSHPEVKHGRIAIAFTPDEEIGEGTKYFDLSAFGADFAYTVDGGVAQEYADETFNAAGAVVTFDGFSIHPGSAKDKMINAAGVAMEFHALLPQWMRPEHTEGYEGFIHLTGMKGNTVEAVLEYILRDHDYEKLQDKKRLMESALNHIRMIYGKDSASVRFTDGYRNMRDILKDHPEVAELARKSLLELGIEPGKEIIRGGTDGAELTFRGLPCPNLGTGTGNMHGRHEYVVVSQMETVSKLIRTIIKNVSEM